MSDANAAAGPRGEGACFGNLGRWWLVTATLWGGMVAGWPATISAQVSSPPRFTAAVPATGRILGADLTVGSDGSITVLWVEIADSSDYKSGKAMVRRFSPAGAPLGPPTRVETTGWASEEVPATIRPSGTGGYVATWNLVRPFQSAYRYELYGAVLDANGALVGPDFEVSREGARVDTQAAGSNLVVHDSGFAIAWIETGTLWLRLYDATGAAQSGPLPMANVPTGVTTLIDLELMDDGRILLVWQRGSGSASAALFLDANGRPLGPPFSLAPSGWQVHDVAVSPLGVIAEISSLGATTVVRRHDDTGAVLGEDVVATTEARSGDLAFDDNGNLFAAWTERVSVSVTRGRARGYDADGVPLSPSFSLDPTSGFSSLDIAAAAGGQFVTTWLEASVFPMEQRANGYAFCTPGTTTCGDGVHVSACEQCDDGAANDDSLPNACRTDCRRAGCGDGVIDTGEQCEDGNTVGGDCCSHWCRHELDFDQDGLCDAIDNCDLFPNPDQSDPEVCTPQSIPKLSEESLESFADGLKDFAEIETPETGLGPVFNGASCAECHHQPTIGGSSTRTVTRFGRIGIGGAFDPMTALGGSLLQANGITSPSCTVVGEVVPPSSDVMATRDSPPLFGLGFVDGIEDARILRLADPNDRNGDGISGRPHMIGGRVGRFGWKAQVVSLRDFTAEAYQTEMGITNPVFPTESSPQGEPLTCDAVPDPEDDGSAVSSLTSFVTLLAPLPIQRLSRDARLGRALFKRVNCRSCHTEKTSTGSSPVKALNRKKLSPFSDFLLHDMGPGLADGITQGSATGSEFRTAPLWGARDSAPYLHDGRAATLHEAIAAHGGEAERSRSAFMALPATEQAALIEYLSTL